MASNNHLIRAAEPKDVLAIFRLIQELATFERAPEQVSNTSTQLQIDLFEDRICEALVAESPKEMSSDLHFTIFRTPPGKVAAFILRISMYWNPNARKAMAKHYLMKSLLQLKNGVFDAWIGRCLTGIQPHWISTAATTPHSTQNGSTAVYFLNK